jgi:parallel beta-helix repeat protein
MKKEKVLNKTALTVALAILFLVAFTAAVASAATTIYVPDNYTTIQQAVNNASQYDTIIVRDTYTGTKENIIVFMTHLTIRSENGSANCIVNASDSNNHVFNVQRGYLNISGFTVENATGTLKAGISLLGSGHCNISDNNVSNNYNGIYLGSSSNNNTLTNNSASNNDRGIELYSSSNNTLTNNTASNNHNGISLWYWSNKNTLTGNICNSNNNNGIYLQSSNNKNSLTSNTASNNTNHDFYSDENSHDNTIEDLTIASYPTTISFTYDQGIKIKGVTTPEPDPAGKVNISKYVDATNVTADSWLFLNVSYSDADVTGIDEGSLLLYRWNGTA